MKFGKELQAQLVPEWQDAYINYNFLKKILKDIIQYHHSKTSSRSDHIFSNNHHPNHENNNNNDTFPPDSSAISRRSVSFYRAFSGLTCRSGHNHNHTIYNHHHHNRDQHEEENAILVSKIHEDGYAEGRYQTMFLRSSSADDGGEVELLFFKRLDDEFNKVVRFFRGKVDEILKEADELSRQMDALIALRVKVDNPLLLVPPNSIDSSQIGLSHRQSGKVYMDTIQELEMNGKGGRLSGELKKSKVRNTGSGGGYKPAPLEVLENVKINLVPDTPVETLKGIVLDSKLDLSYNKAELRKAEQLMTQAFIEFHQRLRLLKSYRFSDPSSFRNISVLHSE